MKFGLEWLSEWVAIDQPVNDIADILTSAGLEVDSVAPAGVGLDNVVIARIDSAEQHPNADKLSVCQVDDGSGELVTVVCGAPNVAQGQKVVVATVGATLYPL